MKNHCKSASFSSILPPNGLFLMDIRWLCGSISIGCLLQPKKMGFWVQKGKILKFSKFLIRLTSEALEALLCFPKGKKMFVSREDLQTMILSTEQPLCHVGEPRYGPPKFFGGKPKIPEKAFLSF